MTIVVFGGELIFPKKFHFQKFFFKVFYKIVLIYYGEKDYIIKID